MENEEAIIPYLSRIPITLAGKLDMISFLGRTYKSQVLHWDIAKTFLFIEQ